MRRIFGRASRVFDVIFAVALFGLFAIGAAWFEVSNSPVLSGNFRVVDGDSLTQGEQKLRLVGIDAPEYNQICEKGDAEYRCGREAAKYLRSLVARQNLSCRSEGADKYDRQLVECFIGDESINAAMVRAGWAVAYGSYYRLERRARDEGAGLWAGNFDRPDDWRARYGGLLESELGGVMHRLLRRLRNLI